MHPLHRDRLPRERGVSLRNGAPVLAELWHRDGGGLQPRQHQFHRNRGRRGSERRGQRRMYRGDRLPQPVGLPGEIPADLVGVEVALGVEVAGARGGHVPAVGGVGRVGGHHQKGTGLPAVGGVQRAQQRGDVRIAGPPQHPGEFDIGVHPAVDAAEQLEDGLLGEHHAGVALLALDHPRLSARRWLHTRLPDDPGQHRPRRIRVVESVVHGRIALLDENLVPLGGAVGVGDVDQGVVQPVAEGKDGVQRRGDQRAIAPGVPPLLRQPVRPGQPCDVRRHEPSSSLNQ